LLKKLSSLSKVSFLVAVVVATLLLACKHEAEKTATGGNVIRLSYWCAPNPRETMLANELVEQWNAQNDSVKVDVQPIPASQSSEEVLLAAIAAKTTPDICSNMWPGAMDDFISSGGLVRLDQFPDFDEFISERISENLLTTFKALDGHYYQLPWKTNPTMIIYNKSLFKKAGVQAPLKTYDSFLSAAARLTVDKDGDGKIDQWMLYRNIKPIWWQRLFDFYPFYIAASGGKTLFHNNQIDFNNISAVEVFRFFNIMYKNKFMPITEFQGDKFLAGQLATQITGPQFIAYIKQYKTDDFKFGVMPIPVPEGYKGDNYTSGDYKNISVFSTTKFPRQSWQFAKYLISAKADLRLLQVASQIPVRKNLTEDSLYRPYFEKEPEMAVFALQAIHTRGVDGVPDLKEVFDVISQEYESSAIYGVTSPAQGIKDASARVKVIMAWNRK